MGKTDKQQNAHGSLNAYERQKLLRVQENQQRLRDLGVKKTFASLISLAESRKTDKRKEKKKVMSERDLEYIPNIDGGIEGDDEEESATSATVPKKVNQQRHQFIPPMSMNKYVALKKRRVIAPNLAESLTGMQYEEGFQQNDHLFDKNAMQKNHSMTIMTKVSGITQHPVQFEGIHEGHEQLVNTNDPKKKQSKKPMSVGELVLQKKQSQQTSGPRRKLVLTNNEDDGLDDMGTTDMNEANRERDGDEEGDGVDIDQMLLEAGLVSAEEGDSEERDSDNDIGYDDLNEFEEELEEPLPAKEVNSNPKRRGPTMMHDIHTRPFEKREVIICNKLGQPIGPKENDVVGRFSRFLGSIACIYSYAPLTHRSWHKVPHKNKIWEFVLEKYIVPDFAKAWVLKSIGASWRGYKCWLKRNHFYKHKDNKTRWKNRPKHISDDDFMQMLGLWNNKEEKKRCSVLKDHCKAQKNMHTVGPISFARIREELKNDPNKKLPSSTRVFEYTRKRKEGHIYVEPYDDTAKKIVRLYDKTSHQLYFSLM